MKYSVAIIQITHQVAHEVIDEHVFDNLNEATQFVNDWNAMQVTWLSNGYDPRVVAMNPLPFA